jgi:hypothetical protein
LLGLAAEIGTPLSIIGEISPGVGVRVVDRDGGDMAIAAGGYRHF